jgi:beta-galactosidase
VKRNPVHIETRGVYANPVRNANGEWSIPIKVALYSSEEAPVNVEVVSMLFDPSGKKLVS